MTDTPTRTSSSASPCIWPDGARIALWIVPTLEFFPLDMAPKGVKPPGGLERPYPDYWNYTLRDYGNRVGFARIFRALEERGLKASVAMSSRLAERYPHVLQEVNRLGFELMAHGIDMNHIHADGHSPARSSGSGSSVHSRPCAGSRASRSRGGTRPPIRKPTTRSISSRPRAASMCATGSTTTCPTGSRPRPGPIHAMPHAYEISDLQIFHFYKYKPAQFVEQVMDHFDLLYREAATSGGRIVALIAQALDQRGAAPHCGRRAGAGPHAAPRRRVVGDRQRNSRCLESPAVAAPVQTPR